jgi:hypothetical protein
MKIAYKPISDQRSKTLQYLAISYASTVIVLGAALWGQMSKSDKLGRQYLEATNQINYLTEVMLYHTEKVDAQGREIGRLKAELDSKKLSPKALKHVQAHPKAASLIKEQFGADWIAATELFSKESGLYYKAVNPSSGACGLPQSLPCSKLTSKCDFEDVACQVKWGYDYILARYGSASKALAFHLIKNWY